MPMIVKLYLTAGMPARAVADDLTDVVDVPAALPTLTEEDGRSNWNPGPLAGP